MNNELFEPVTEVLRFIGGTFLVLVMFFGLLHVLSAIRNSTLTRLEDWK